VREITYELAFDDGRRMEFTFRFDKESFALVLEERPAWPDWTLLACERCDACPLDDGIARCPLAAALVDIVEATSGIVSHAEVTAMVRGAGRTVTARLPAQDALRSLMGLLIPASGCPDTAFLRPMARFHLPFSSPEETLYRTASMYRLAQQLRRIRGLEEDPGFAGLSAAYARLNAINRHLVERLRAATRRDSATNAVTLLDVFAQLLPMQLDEPLEEVGPLFGAYLG
jgi:hypothetical protein